MAVNLDAKIDLDNKSITESADKHATDLLENINNLLAGKNDGDREEWVKKIHDHFRASFPTMGVMVIHRGQQQIHAPKGSYKHFPIEFHKSVGTEGFEVYVIKKGSGTVVTNSGDGGFINWRFSGHAKRDGATVTF